MVKPCAQLASGPILGSASHDQTGETLASALLYPSLRSSLNTYASICYTLKCMQPLACLFVCWQNRARAFITVRMAKPAASRKTAAGMARSGDIMCTLANTLMTLVACQPTPHLILASHARPAHVL